MPTPPTITGLARAQLPGAPAPPPQTPPPRRATGLLSPLLTSSPPQQLSSLQIPPTSQLQGHSIRPRPFRPLTPEAPGFQLPLPSTPATHCLISNYPQLSLPLLFQPGPSTSRSPTSGGRPHDPLRALPCCAPGLDLQVCRLISSPPLAGSAHLRDWAPPWLPASPPPLLPVRRSPPELGIPVLPPVLGAPTTLLHRGICLGPAVTRVR